MPPSQQTTRSYRCSSSNAQNFLGIFNMITPNGESPRVGAKISLNTANGAVDCPISVWCADYGASASSGERMPIWLITTITAGCGIALGLGVFVYAKYKLRPQREDRGHSAVSQNPLPGGGGGGGGLLEKVAAAQRARVGAEAPPPSGGGRSNDEDGGGKIEIRGG
ncbi:hypothetical protein BC829DRAFT_127922 [Chytridium lagenaria]|nr:hypothetical protein BC829DRAFT_127922 [Chytridium lagenaria]